MKRISLVFLLVMLAVYVAFFTSIPTDAVTTVKTYLVSANEATLRAGQDTCTVTVMKDSSAELYNPLVWRDRTGKFYYALADSQNAVVKNLYVTVKSWFAAGIKSIGKDTSQTMFVDTLSTRAFCFKPPHWVSSVRDSSINLIVANGSDTILTNPTHNLITIRIQDTVQIIADNDSLKMPVGFMRGDYNIDPCLTLEMGNGQEAIVNFYRRNAAGVLDTLAGRMNFYGTKANHRITQSVPTYAHDMEVGDRFWASVKVTGGGTVIIKHYSIRMEFYHDCHD